MKTEVLEVQTFDDDEAGEAESKGTGAPSTPGAPSRIRARLGAMVPFQSKRDRGSETRQRSRTVAGTT